MLMLSCLHDPCINCAAINYVENCPKNSLVSCLLSLVLFMLKMSRRDPTGFLQCCRAAKSLQKHQTRAVNQRQQERVRQEIPVQSQHSKSQQITTQHLPTPIVQTLTLIQKLLTSLQELSLIRVQTLKNPNSIHTATILSAYFPNIPHFALCLWDESQECITHV